MEKMISFCKKNYKVLIPVMVVFVLLLAIYFVFREYKYDNYRNKQEESVYQYFLGDRMDYTAIVTYNLKDVIVDVDAKDIDIEYDSTPIYYTDMDKVIFPEEMTIVFPLRNVSQYKLYKYSIYEKRTGLHMITTNTNTSDYNNFFLYDGNDTYFFPDGVTLMINDKEYKKLGDMSYVSVVGGYTLSYYDKGTDTSDFIEIDGDIVSVVSENINVNLTKHSCLYFDKSVLLFPPKGLNVVSKIDWQRYIVNDIIKRE